MDSYKNPDGSIDLDRVFRDFSAERERADGLRKKLADSTPKPQDPFSAKDLDLPIAEEERQAMDDLVHSFNECGISRDQAQKVFKKLADLVPTDEQQQAQADARYREELKKLGPERDTIIAHLAAFSDSMVNNNIWTADQRALFRDSITSADTAKLFHSAIQNFNRAYPGSFSPATTNAQDPAQNQYSNAEKRDMYRQAFERMKTNHIDGEMEIKRLDKLFGVK
jgi:hypothetical protein